MEPEPDEGQDTFLRRVAQVAAFGAAVGAAVGAARAAARRNGAGADERQEVESAEAGQEEPQEREEEPQAREPEPSEDDEEESEKRPEPRAEDDEEESERRPEPRAEDEEEESERRPEPRAEEEGAEEEEPEEEPVQREPAPEEQHAQSSDGQLDGETAGLIGRALRQVQELTGREADGVLGLRRDNGNWVVSVEIVELHRVPSSTDVLASYDVVLDGNGELREYNRTGRYIRGRAEQ